MERGVFISWPYLIKYLLGGADLNCLSLDLKFDKLEMMKVDTENREFGKLNVPPDIEILHEDCEMKEFPF